MEATCGLLQTGDFPDAERGLEAFVDAGGQLRVAVFELTGVESSARVETIADSDAQRLVIELNPRFQFEPGLPRRPDDRPRARPTSGRARGPDSR